MQQISHLFSAPLICFLFGLILTFFTNRFRFKDFFLRALTILILFEIGFKGGAPLVDSLLGSAQIFARLLGFLICWGFIQPFLSFYLLSSFTKVDKATCAAISASFGSISVMTMIAAFSFLEQIQVQYDPAIFAILAIMEIPAIFSGLFLAKWYCKDDSFDVNSTSFKKIIWESIMNKVMIALIGGLILGSILSYFHISIFNKYALLSFKPLLCLFLFEMGRIVSSQRTQLKVFSFSLICFGLYMPLLGAAAGLFFSHILNLNVGDTTLITVLLASASYIAVPVAMKIALPTAKEAVYLPLSLGIAFPFNVLIGIPLYYTLAHQFV